jgi:hypothetical protein
VAARPATVRLSRPVPVTVTPRAGRAGGGVARRSPRPGLRPRPAARPAGRSERAAPTRRDPAPIRLTHRGRLLARALLIVAALALVVGLAAVARASSAEPAPRGPLPSVVVQPGDTLWNIAARHAPDAAPIVVIDQIRRLNHLNGSGIEVGQQLVLPRR